MPRQLNVACLQTRPMPDFDTALNEALGLAERAVKDGAEFLFLPEYCGGLLTDGPALVPPVANEESHPVVRGLQEFARDNKVWISIGSVAVPGPEGKILNRSLMVDAKGMIVSRYDKIHMFDIQLSETEVYQESAKVSAGNQAVLTQTPMAVFGHSICYDLRFPYLYRDLAHAGAEILLTPAAFTKKTSEAHWHVLNQARAIENGAFVIAACAVGDVPGGGEAYGHSLIIAPWGDILADGGEGDGVAQALIDLDEVAVARAKIPNLQHDREFTILDTSRKDVA
ncbi:MAG: carbon-nitrogen hydrolase family protein [Hyphomicrobiales bacterium]